MPPSLSSLDPEGYYARLGLTPEATRAGIVAAYRAKARTLHPDVPGTGDAAAFVAVKQAYDVLSDSNRRAAYDRSARQAAMDAIKPEVFVVRPAYAAPVSPMAAQSAPRPMPMPTGRPPRLSDMPLFVWLGMGAFLALCVTEAVMHLRSDPPKVAQAEIKPNAAPVAPLPPAARQAVLYGPMPVHLPGVANFYVVPTATPAVLWRLDKDRNTLVPMGQLPPFSSVQAIKLYQRNGMLEVMVDDHSTGFIQAAHLTPGNLEASRRAYCGYNAGPAPMDGEVLHRYGAGPSRLELENRAVQPAVVKLRSAGGHVAAAIFLAPGGHADVSGLPAGTYHPEYAIGEQWSRACNTFAAGMRARRMDMAFPVPNQDPLVITADVTAPDTREISEADFEAE